MNEAEGRRETPEWLKKALEEAMGPNYEPAHTQDEARVNFKGTLMEFFDRAYQRIGSSPPRSFPRVMDGGGPQAGITSIEEYLLCVRAAKMEFGEDAFALLMNPTDFAKMELLDFDINQRYIFDKDPNEQVFFAGLVCIQAIFVEETHFSILDEVAFNEILRLNPKADRL